MALGFTNLVFLFQNQTERVSTEKVSPLFGASKTFFFFFFNWPFREDTLGDFLLAMQLLELIQRRSQKPLGDLKSHGLLLLIRDWAHGDDDIGDHWSFQDFGGSFIFFCVVVSRYFLSSAPQNWGRCPV